jgi:hypothetical protein
VEERPLKVVDDLDKEIGKHASVDEGRESPQDRKQRRLDPRPFGQKQVEDDAARNDRKRRDAPV